jgi:hypothetical protein
MDHGDPAFGLQLGEGVFAFELAGAMRAVRVVQVREQRTAGHGHAITGEQALQGVNFEAGFHRSRRPSKLLTALSTSFMRS